MRADFLSVRIGPCRFHRFCLAGPRKKRSSRNVLRPWLAVEQVETRNLLSATFPLPVDAFLNSGLDARTESAAVEQRPFPLDLIGQVDPQPSPGATDSLRLSARPSFSQVARQTDHGLTASVSLDLSVPALFGANGLSPNIVTAVDVSAVLFESANSPVSWDSLHESAHGGYGSFNFSHQATGTQDPAYADSSHAALPLPLWHEAPVSAALFGAGGAGGEADDNSEVALHSLTNSTEKRSVSAGPEAFPDIDRWSTLAGAELTEPAPTTGGAVDIRHVLESNASTPMSLAHADTGAPKEAAFASALAPYGDDAQRDHGNPPDIHDANRTGRSVGVVMTQSAGTAADRGSQGRWQPFELAVIRAGAPRPPEVGSDGAAVDASARATDDRVSAPSDAGDSPISRLNQEILRPAHSESTPMNKAVDRRTADTVATPTGSTADAMTSAEPGDNAVGSEASIEGRHRRDRQTAQVGGFDFRSTIVALTIVTAATPLLVMERRQAERHRDPSQLNCTARGRSEGRNSAHAQE